jgi:hypothetical protein
MLVVLSFPSRLKARSPKVAPIGVGSAAVPSAPSRSGKRGE